MNCPAWAVACAHAVFCSEGDKSFPLSGDVWVPVLVRIGKEAQTRGMRIVGSGFICRPVVAGGLRYVLVCPQVRHGGIARRALARLRVPCRHYGCTPSCRARWGFAPDGLADAFATPRDSACGMHRRGAVGY